MPAVNCSTSPTGVCETVIEKGASGGGDSRGYSKSTSEEWEVDEKLR